MSRIHCCISMAALIVMTALGAGLAPPCAAQAADTTVLDAVRAGVEDEYASLEALYHHFHAHPELSFHEEATSARMAQEFRALGFEVTTGVGGHGLVAVLRNGDGPTVMLRADMDALPVEEETGLTYASTAVAKDDLGREVHVMHACGHDVHLTSLVGTARLLTQMREAWKGTLVLIAQPAEERGAGALAMLTDGLFTRFPRPDYALALHVSATLETGKVAFVKGFAMANVDSVDIKIHGIGGHGAYPHMTKDPIVIAAELVMALQTIVSREIAPTDPAVVTVGSIHGGTKHNVIPNEVDLQLTVRSYSDETRAHILDAIARIAKNIAEGAGLPAELLPEIRIKENYTPATYNSPELVERASQAIAKCIGERNVVEEAATMGGEDFGRYGREEPRLPIFMFRLGAIPPERVAASLEEGAAPLPSLHSSRFAPAPERTIKTGVKAMTAAVLDLMR